jgi:NAD+ diphosphatase
MSRNRKFISGIAPTQERSSYAWWFIFMKDKLLAYQKPGSVTVPSLINPNELGMTFIQQNYLGQLDNHHRYAAEVTKGTIPAAGMVFEGLRQVYGFLDEDLF